MSEPFPDEARAALEQIVDELIAENPGVVRKFTELFQDDDGSAWLSYGMTEKADQITEVVQAAANEPADDDEDGEIDLGDVESLIEAAVDEVYDSDTEDDEDDDAGLAELFADQFEPAGDQPELDVPVLQMTPQQLETLAEEQGIEFEFEFDDEAVDA